VTREGLATKIKLGREQSGLSQSELASKLTISQGTVSNWETGKAQPDAGQLKRLKSILGPQIFSEQWTPGVLEGPSIVGAWLSKARQKSGLTQQELAEKAGVTQVTISHIETGRALNPQQKTIKLLADALGEPFDKEARLELEQASQVEGIGRFTDFNPHDPADYPNEPGVYVFFDNTDRPIYVGMAKNVGERIKQHHDKWWFRDPIVQKASYVQVKDDRQRAQIEAILIGFLKSNAVFNKQQVQRD